MAPADADRGGTPFYPEAADRLRPRRDRDRLGRAIGSDRCAQARRLDSPHRAYLRGEPAILRMARM